MHNYVSILTGSSPGLTQDKPMALVVDALELQGAYMHATVEQRTSNGRTSMWDGTGTGTD